MASKGEDGYQQDYQYKYLQGSADIISDSKYIIFVDLIQSRVFKVMPLWVLV